MLHYAKKIAGFTVVELIVVVAVLGILASIGLVSYNISLVAARNTDRFNELKSWENAFTLHAQLKRHYPSVPSSGTYCLGTGFPTAADITPYVPGGHSFTPSSPDGYCGNLLTSSGRHVVNSHLNAQLLAITDKKPGSKSFKQSEFAKWKTAIGPYAKFDAGRITLSHIFEGESCPKGTSATDTYPDGQHITCSVVLPDNYTYTTP